MFIKSFKNLRSLCLDNFISNRQVEATRGINYQDNMELRNTKAVSR